MSRLHTTNENPQFLAGDGLAPTPCLPCRLCRTNPISPVGHEFGGRNVQNEPNLHLREGIGGASPTLQGGVIAPNKPNSPGWQTRRGSRRGKCAKRTQFPSPTEEVGRGRPTYQESAGQNARNEPNSQRGRVGRGPRGEECETNPIRPSWQAGRVAEGKNVRNEPNSGRRYRHRRDECAKRTQFRRDRVERGSEDAGHGLSRQTKPIPKEFQV